MLRTCEQPHITNLHPNFTFHKPENKNKTTLGSPHQPFQQSLYQFQPLSKVLQAMRAYFWRPEQETPGLQGAGREKRERREATPEQLEKRLEPREEKLEEREERLGEGLKQGLE